MNAPFESKIFLTFMLQYLHWLFPKRPAPTWWSAKLLMWHWRAKRPDIQSLTSCGDGKMART